MYSISRQHQKSKMALPLLYVKLYLYQLSRALSHIHALGICHRDIKPQNLLVNPENQQLKLCDFGSAKALVRGEPNVSYICSRYYRAPELIFGSTDYSTAIDIWSQGERTMRLIGRLQCVFVSMFVCVRHNLHAWRQTPKTSALTYLPRIHLVIVLPFRTQDAWERSYCSGNRYSPAIPASTSSWRSSRSSALPPGRR